MWWPSHHELSMISSSDCVISPWNPQATVLSVHGSLTELCRCTEIFANISPHTHTSVASPGICWTRMLFGSTVYETDQYKNLFRICSLRSSNAEIHIPLHQISYLHTTVSGSIHYVEVTWETGVQYRSVITGQGYQLQRQFPFNSKASNISLITIHAIYNINLRHKINQS
jgi:hypothetical protein